MKILKKLIKITIKTQLKLITNMKNLPKNELKSLF